GAEYELRRYLHGWQEHDGWQRSSRFAKRGGIHSLTSEAGNSMPIRLVILVAAVTLTHSAVGLELKSLRFGPVDIRTGSSAAEVTIHFTVADEVSDVRYFEASFVDPSGVSRLSASVELSPSAMVTGSVKIVFPQFTNSGTWT